MVSFIDSACFSTCRNSSVRDIAGVNVLSYYVPVTEFSLLTIGWANAGW